MGLCMVWQKGKGARGDGALRGVGWGGRRWTPPPHTHTGLHTQGLRSLHGRLMSGERPWPAKDAAAVAGPNIASGA